MLDPAPPTVDLDGVLGLGEVLDPDDVAGLGEEDAALEDKAEDQPLESS